MHVIPSCEIPSFCTTDASSHTGNARLEPYIGNAESRESVAGILTEKSLGDVLVAPRTLGSNLPRIRTGYVVFLETLLRSPAGFGFAWRAESD